MNRDRNKVFLILYGQGIGELGGRTWLSVAIGESVGGGGRDFDLHPTNGTGGGGAKRYSEIGGWGESREKGEKKIIVKSALETRPHFTLYKTELFYHHSLIKEKKSPPLRYSRQPRAVPLSDF